MRAEQPVVGRNDRETDEWNASPWWRGLGWAVVAGWALLVVLVPVTGERESTYGTLVGDLVDGVAVVEVDGMLTGSATGWSVARVHWSSGGIDRVTEVVDASSAREARRARREMEGWEAPQHVQVGLADALRDWAPGVRVEARPAGESSGPYGQVLGWRTPGWVALAVLTLGLVTLGLVVSGPRPRRATRWAWFWMLAASPIGLALYLAFGGPAGRREPPPATASRVGGGLGFVAALVLGAAWAWTRP